MTKRRLLWIPVLVAVLTVAMPIIFSYTPKVRLEFSQGDSGHINPAGGFYSLDSALVSRKIKPDKDFPAELYIHNGGVADLPDQYAVNLVISGDRNTTLIPLYAQEKAHTVKLTAKYRMPVDMADDTLLIGVQIADKEQPFGDERYPVALQNMKIVFTEGTNYFAVYRKTDDGYVLNEHIG